MQNSRTDAEKQISSIINEYKEKINSMTQMNENNQETTEEEEKKEEKEEINENLSVSPQEIVKQLQIQLEAV